MKKSITHYTITASDGSALNPLTEVLIIDFPDLKDALEEFQTKEKSSSMFGSGDNAIVEIHFSIDHSDVASYKMLQEFIEKTHEIIEKVVIKNDIDTNE